VFATAIHFHPSLIFGGKARRLPLERSLVSYSVQAPEGFELDELKQGILTITVPLTSYLESAVDNCQFLFLFAKQTNPNQSNNGITVPLTSCLTGLESAA
jgi:hypothetical protein